MLEPFLQLMQTASAANACGVVVLNMLIVLMVWAASIIMQLIVAWVEDSSFNSTYNPILHVICLLRGATPRGAYLYHPYEYRGDTCKTEDLVFFPMVLLGTLPLLSIYIVAHAPVFAVTIGIGLALLFVARFVRRLQKSLEAHAADKEAHK